MDIELKKLRTTPVGELLEDNRLIISPRVVSSGITKSLTISCFLMDAIFSVSHVSISSCESKANN